MKLFSSPNKLIVRSVKPYFPVGHLKYTGQSSDYAIFRIDSRAEIYSGSGVNHSVRSYGFIDVFTTFDPSGENSVMSSIENALLANNINVLNISTTYDPEDNVFHTEFEIEVVQDV